MTADSNFDSLSQESRVFTPPSSFSSQSHFTSLAEYQALFDRAAQEPDGFWREMANQNLIWEHPFSKVLTWEPPFSKWFEDGTLNASVQCLDKFQNTSTWNKTALLWEGEDGSVRKISYAELSAMTNQVANALKTLGVSQGDIVTIYMPLVPEVVVAMLACARLGAAHSVVFGGFSSEALKDRINDARSKVVVTADGGYRRGQIVPLKAAVDKALESTPSVQNVVVLKRTGEEIAMHPTRDVWWSDLVSKQSRECPAVAVPSEQLLFTLYTSGTTGKPKGIMHSTAGFLLWTQLTTRWVFDLNDNDVYWCTADVGWVTGHSYLVYGPLQNGVTAFMYEGAPQYPDWGRFWKMIDAHKITILYTAPTAIRAFMGQGDSIPDSYDLSSLRLLGSVGEPINPEAWIWYYKHIGRERCPIVDTWWQTETGGILISPLPGATPMKPGSCTLPLPGVHPAVIRKDRAPTKPNEGGYLVITQPWPGMLRGIYGDPERFKKTYFSDFGDYYFTGDGARRDQDGYFWLMGRVDDVINVSGHRLGTAEIESALVSHDAITEAAVVGRPDPLKGQAIVAFVTLEVEFARQLKDTESLIRDMKNHVVKQIGALARPDEIKIVVALPKTRSGKIMRRLLREIATSGAATGDTTTLEDVGVLEKLMQQSGDDEG